MSISNWIAVVLMMGCSVSSAAQTLDDPETLKLLRAMGETQAAQQVEYAMAITAAQQQDTMASWRAVFQQPQYAHYLYPKTRGEIYGHLWQVAERNNTPADYQTLIELAPASVGVDLAIDKIYQLVKQQNTVTAYSEFMAQYPESLQALEALTRLHELLWEQVKAENTIAGYDQYADTFATSQFAAQASAAADHLEAQPFRQRLDSCYQEAERLREEQKGRGEITAKREADTLKKECREDLARELFNKARKTTQARTALRWYQVLDNFEDFTNTKVLTESLDRQERQAHENAMRSLLSQQLEKQQQQADALIAALENQTQRLEQASDKQTQRLEQALEKNRIALSQDLEHVRTQINQGSGLMDKLQGQAVGVISGFIKQAGCPIGGFIPAVGPFVTGLCKIL